MTGELIFHCLVAPGDEFIPTSREQATYAVTINAPSGKVWPRLVQTGQDHGGFYSYTFPGESLMGCAMLEVHRLRPGWTARTGETVWFGT